MRRGGWRARIAQRLVGRRARGRRGGYAVRLIGQQAESVKRRKDGESGCRRWNPWQPNDRRSIGRRAHESPTRQTAAGLYDESIDTSPKELEKKKPSERRAPAQAGKERCTSLPKGIPCRSSEQREYPFLWASRADVKTAAVHAATRPLGKMAAKESGQRSARLPRHRIDDSILFNMLAHRLIHLQRHTQQAEKTWRQFRAEPAIALSEAPLSTATSNRRPAGMRPRAGITCGR